MADPRLLLITHLLAAGAGCTLAPREMLETEVTHTGFFQVNTKRVLSAAVESLRAENSMVVYRYKGSAAVSVERDGFLLFDGRQDLIVPAAVSFLVDLSRLTVDDVTYDEAARLLTVQLPALTLGDVAFEPEGARTINGGLLTFSPAKVDELTKLNYASARKAFVKQAQDPTLVATAKRQAVRNVTMYFKLPLHVIGQSEVRVVVQFAT